MAHIRSRRGSSFPPPFLPAGHAVEVSFPVESTDRFGDQSFRPGPWQTVRVMSWWVDRSEEGREDSVLRTTDFFHAHFPRGEGPGPGGRVRTPDGRVWSVIGNPENFDHGPFGFSPGIDVVHAKEVVG